MLTSGYVIELKLMLDNKPINHFEHSQMFSSAWGAKLLNYRIS